MTDKITEHLIDVVYNRNELRDLFFEYSPNMNCIVSEKGFFVDLNSRWVEETGWSRDEMCSTSFFTFVHPEDLEKTVKLFSTEADENGLVNTGFIFTNRYKKKDGSYVELEWTSSYYVVAGVTYAYAIVKKLNNGDK